MSWKQKTPRPNWTRGHCHFTQSSEHRPSGDGRLHDYLGCSAGAAGVSVAGAAGAAGASAAGAAGVSAAGAAAPEPASAGAAAAGASAAGGVAGVAGVVVAAGSQPMIMARDSSPMYFFISVSFNSARVDFGTVRPFSAYRESFAPSCGHSMEEETQLRQIFPTTDHLSVTRIWIT